jgi:probable F420-dependent oxidoreductase
MRLGTGVLIAPVRKPVLLARELTTLDVVSNGRLLVGLGVGWLAPEFDIAGEDFPSRGPRTDEIIEILRRLWTEKEIAYEGRHYVLPRMAFEPKPISRPHPPILIGGQSRAALRRAALLGDGWYGVDLDLEEAARTTAEMTRMRSDCPRAGEPFESTLLLQSAGATLDAAELEKYGAAGIQRIVVGFGNAPNREVIPLLEKLASRIRVHLES